jgi:hypothetical protein
VISNFIGIPERFFISKKLSRQSGKIEEVGYGALAKMQSAGEISKMVRFQTT